MSDFKAEINARDSMPKRLDVSEQQLDYVALRRVGG